MKPIKCSAIKTVEGAIYTGKRHFNCFAAIQEAGMHTHFGAIQGFLDEDDNFLNREEALVVAKAFGQINKKYPPLHELCSEDFC